MSKKLTNEKGLVRHHKSDPVKQDNRGFPWEKPNPIYFPKKKKKEIIMDKKVKLTISMTISEEGYEKHIKEMKQEILSGLMQKEMLENNK